MTAATAITPMTWRNTWDRGRNVSEVLSTKEQQSQKLHCCCVGYHWRSEGYLLKLNKRTSFTCVCVRPSGTYSKVTAGCGTEVVWLTVWEENDHCTNSHLEAGENLPLGHCSSYLWLSGAFPSTLLACKPPWQSSQPTGTATVTGRGLWEPHCGCLIHCTQTTQPSTTQWLITRVNGSVTHLDQDTRAAWTGLEAMSLTTPMQSHLSRYTNWSRYLIK